MPKRSAENVNAASLKEQNERLQKTIKIQSRVIELERQERARGELLRARDNDRWSQRVEAMTWALTLAQEAARQAQEQFWDEQEKAKAAFNVKEGDSLAVAS